MKTLDRIIYPLFSWLLLIGYGVQAASSQVGWIVLVISLAMIALPDSYFRHHLRGVETINKWDLAAFLLGSIPSLIYFALLTLNLSENSLSWGA